MTIRFRFSGSDLVTTAGVAMRPLEIDDKGGLFERVGQPGITERFSHEDLAELLRRPDTSWMPDYFDLAKQQLRGRKPVDMINELPVSVRRDVLWRKAFYDAFLTLERSGEISRTERKYKAAGARLRPAHGFGKKPAGGSATGWQRPVPHVRERTPPPASFRAAAPPSHGCATMNGPVIRRSL